LQIQNSELNRAFIFLPDGGLKLFTFAALQCRVIACPAAAGLEESPDSIEQHTT
jgi:hypothetical protein